jgi:hypothetical protein
MAVMTYTKSKECWQKQLLIKRVDVKYACYKLPIVQLKVWKEQKFSGERQKQVINI